MQRMEARALFQVHSVICAVTLNHSRNGRLRLTYIGFIYTTDLNGFSMSIQRVTAIRAARSF